MIQLERVRTKDAIPSSFRGATPRKRLVKLMQEVRAKLAANEEVKLSFPSKWSVTKAQLLAETHDKCAYCETPTKVVAFGDVEHYRPKSVYWWLAYVYDNYLASCAVCNQQFKGNKFERTGAMMPAPTVEATTTDDALTELAKTAVPDPLKTDLVSDFETAHQAEAPLLPNPYIEDPETIFAWDVLEGTEEVEVIAQPGVPRAAEIIDAVERIYGLNRPELKRLRYKQYRFYRTFRETVDTPGLPDNIRDMNLQMIELMTKPDSQYAAMIRFFEEQHTAG